ncbi:MAG: hypothetical protein IJW29_01520 [Clostridia bacterium]|nr:hypothetical protein [Clostridia bacterium]
MHFDPLLNPDATETLERITQDYLRDPRALLKALDADVCSVSDAVQASRVRMDAIRADVAGTVRALEGALRAASDAMPVSRTLFRERVDEAYFGRLCRAIGQLEAEHRALRKELLDYAGVGDALRACYVSAFGVKRRVYAVKRVCREDDRAALCLLAERLQAARERCEALEAELCTLRERTGALCLETLTRFLEFLRVRADLDGDGAACDASAVRALCAEMGQALKPFL